MTREQMRKHLWWFQLNSSFLCITKGTPCSLSVLRAPACQCSPQFHDTLGTSNMQRLLYFCSSWFLVRTSSRSVASCCCCTSGLLSIPGMLDICSRASWILPFSFANSWWTSWLSFSILKWDNINRSSIDIVLFRIICYLLVVNKR